MRVITLETTTTSLQPWKDSEMSENIPFLDLGATYRELQPELDEAYARVMASGWYLLGDELEAFEDEYASYTEARFCVGVASGLDALILALRSVGVEPGHEVIVPSNTYIATWLAVSALGATPVPVEPDPVTHNIDPDLISAAISERTRAILPVHLYGRPAPMGRILDIARSRGLMVVADGAQAHGARYGGRGLGALGDAVAWSFYPGKNLGAFADAGGVTTDNADIADQLRVLRNYGSRKKYHNESRGVNSRMDELQASFLRVKLAHLDDWNGRRRLVAQRYLGGLSDLSSVQPPCSNAEEVGAWHLFVIRCRSRDLLQAELGRLGVQSLIHYPIPPNLQIAYRDEHFAPQPVAEQLAKEVLSLPMGPHLSAGQVDGVLAAISEIDSSGILPAFDLI